MISYKTWKNLNESFGITLGVKSPNNLGFLSNSTTVNPVEERYDLEEKKSKKKMSAETGDGEIVEPTSEKDELPKCCGKKCCKNAKKTMKKAKKMWSGDDEAPPEEESEEEEVPEEECEEEGEEEAAPEEEEEVEEEKPMFSKKKSKKMKNEEDEWWASFRSMTKYNPSQGFDDGWTNYQEDLLLAPTEETPLKPGDVGTSPDTRIGSL